MRVVEILTRKCCNPLIFQKVIGTLQLFCPTNSYVIDIRT